MKIIILVHKNTDEKTKLNEAFHRKKVSSNNQN